MNIPFRTVPHDCRCFHTTESSVVRSLSYQDCWRSCSRKKCHGRLRLHVLRSQAEQTMEVTEDRAKQVRMAVTRRIKELGRAGKAREALQQLAEMARLGVQPDPMLGTALVDACARSGQMQMAQAAFEELFGDGPNSLLEPDDVTFSILVRGYGETEPPQWLAISGLLSKMQSRFNLKPSTATYNALLEVCARTKDLTRGYEIIERMERAGVLPDEQSVEAVKNRRALRTHLKRVFNF